ncbi:MAG: response regulator, partial [Chitinivibrionales bacterium]
MKQKGGQQQRSILIVEDSPTQRERLRILLQDKNFDVHTAKNGEEALAKARELRPEVVVSDVMMPVMSGYDLCRAIKDDPQLKDVTVVLLTALSDPQDVINGLTSGADNFITKPYSDSFLLSRIEYIFVNKSIQHARMSDLGVEIVFGGKRHLINSNRLQIIDLLLSTYENAIQKNHELDSANRELARTKQDLQSLNTRLRSQTDQLQSILESISDGVLVVTPDGKPVIMNPAAREMSGITDISEIEDFESHAHRQKFFDVNDQPVPFEQWPHRRALRGEEFTGLQYRSQIAGQRETRFLEFSTSLIRDAGGEISSVLITAHDITQQKHHE